MQTVTDLNILKLEAAQFLLHIRDALGTRHVIRALSEISKRAWDESFDMASEVHFIQGVGVSAMKGDAIKTYIAKIVKVFTGSVGVRLNAWSVETLCSDNFTNVAIANKISGQTFMTHVELLQVVCTRLLGFDYRLFEYCLADDAKEKAELFTLYMVERYNLGTGRDEILAQYVDAQSYFSNLIDGKGTPEYFSETLNNVSAYYDRPPVEGEVLRNINPLDVIVLMDLDMLQ